MQRALATAGAGFIGSHVARQLGAAFSASPRRALPLPEDRLDAANAKPSARAMIGAGSAS
jgi:hypothetical protein